MICTAIYTICMLFFKMLPPTLLRTFFFFNDPATPEISPLPLHAALPIGPDRAPPGASGCYPGQRTYQRAVDTGQLVDPLQAAERHGGRGRAPRRRGRQGAQPPGARSEEHTSELQSPDHLVCRLLLEKKKQ